MSKEKVLNSDWNILKFVECIHQLNTGLNPRKNFSLGTGELKYITAKNLTKSGTIDFSKCDFIDEDAKRIINKRSDIQVGDILFSSRAPIGHYHLIKEEPYYYDIGESIFSIRVNEEIVMPEYLCLYLSGDYFIKFASKHTTGSIILEIRISDLMNTKIIVPPKHTQKSIAECLNKIDKKIEINNKINEILQQQASLLYDYWFTQFDFPDENGKPYKSSGGKMVWNENLKKEIPDGWSDTTFSDLIKETKSGDWGKETNQGNYTNRVRCIRGADFPAMNSGVLNAPYRFILARNSDKELSNGDIIIEISGGSPTQSTGRVVYINETTLKRFSTNIITSNFCKAVSLKENNFQYWFYLYWKKLYENHVLFGYEGKTTGIKNFLFEDFITLYKIVCPPKELITNFNNTISSTFSKIQLNNIENDELTALRDWLLPMLMNGQATVAEEQKPVLRVVKNDTKNEQPDRFALWLQNQGLAARGDIDRQTLREIFDAMDEDDK